MVHIPSVQHKAADAVSRHPTGPINPDIMPLPDDIAASGASAIPSAFNPSGHSFLAGIRIIKRASSTLRYHRSQVGIIRILIPKHPGHHLATVSETNMVQLLSIIESDFPEFRHELPSALHEYHQFRDHLYSGWRNTLQSTHSHPTLPPPTCPHHPSFGTPGRDLHDRTCRNDCLLARHT